jgi:hypothetical protein
VLQEHLPSYWPSSLSFWPPPGWSPVLQSAGGRVHPTRGPGQPGPCY